MSNTKIVCCLIPIIIVVIFFCYKYITKPKYICGLKVFKVDINSNHWLRRKYKYKVVEKRDIAGYLFADFTMEYKAFSNGNWRTTPMSFSYRLGDQRTDEELIKSALERTKSHPARPKFRGVIVVHEDGVHYFCHFLTKKELSWEECIKDWVKSWYK